MATAVNWCRENNFQESLFQKSLGDGDDSGGDCDGVWQNTPIANAATFTLYQTAWTGVGTTASHNPDGSNRTTITTYSAKDTYLNLANGGADLNLSPAAGTPIVQTNDGTTNTGFKKSGYSNSQTQVTGTGDPASVILGTTTINYPTITQTDNTSQLADPTHQGGWAVSGSAFSTTEQNGTTGIGASVRLTADSTWLYNANCPGLYVKSTDITPGTKYLWKTAGTDCVPPQCSLTGSYPDYLVTDNTVTFGSTYPGREACKGHQCLGANPR